jgi:hypothetical protein
VSETANQRGQVSAGLIVLIAVIVVALGATLWLGLVSGRKPQLPVLGELGSEGFGTPLRIGMELEEARKSMAKSELPVVFVTAEELANRNLYKERGAETDLLGVVYGSDVLDPGDRVRGLRAYLCAPKESKLTLQGRPAAPMKPEDVQELFGKPFSSSAAQDGRTHLIYYFADSAEASNLAYKLTTSHEFDGHMFSLALERVLAPQ